MTNQLMPSLMRLSAAFPRDHVPDSTLTLYASELSDCAPGVLVEVIESMLNHAKAFPAIGQIREEYRGRRLRSPDPTTKRPELPGGRGVPMPDWFKAQRKDLSSKTDERHEELGP